ncbi:heterocyst-inhibiting protein PatX [Trichocoleus sp. FACHB-69]|uniref:heterocyst-inhibiting protein PatX n=1 Tax=Cyanophyceae TaxID=3028117 RepID=UPI0019B7036E|nr:hypothetical protein [Trichocoleus sp. FACHB-69]
MRLYSSILFSTLLVTGLAVNLHAVEKHSENLQQTSSVQQQLSAHDPSQDSAHRGSGRKGLGSVAMAERSF